MISRRDLLVLCIGLPLLLASWGAFILFSRDDLDRQLRDLAGPNAVDCGVLARSGVLDTGPIQNCAVEAFYRKQSFFYRVASAPVAGRPLTSLGTVMTPKKEMYLLTAQEATWENWLGHVTGKMRLYNPRIATTVDGSLTISFDAAPKPASKKPTVEKAPPMITKPMPAEADKKAVSRQ